MSQRWYVICAYRWDELTEDRLLGPYTTPEEAQAVMPFAKATFPRELDAHRNWTICEWDELLTYDYAMAALRRIGALNDDQ